MRVKYDLLVFRCLNCSKHYEKEFDKDLSKTFANTYIFCDDEINKFCLMLRKYIYQCEYMNSCQRFNETSLPEGKKNTAI